MVVDISCDIEGCLLKGRLSTFSSVTVIGTPPLQTIEFFVMNPFLSDLAILCRLGL